ncbi:hypothetical protein QBC47DRAFT_196745 [Echria macrotheca]|uniref:Uncharacterized protein n=1 Tax=Echria macrotheca TaxID=438768 RepID=A0AAJ0BDC8_9PEZI|nr:hypothetical protein QBC47DRAFT_196745 [Echria macrotheca]
MQVRESFNLACTAISEDPRRSCRSIDRCYHDGNLDLASAGTLHNFIFRLWGTDEKNNKARGQTPCRSGPSRRPAAVSGNLNPQLLSPPQLGYGWRDRLEVLQGVQHINIGDEFRSWFSASFPVSPVSLGPPLRGRTDLNTQMGWHSWRLFDILGGYDGEGGADLVCSLVVLSLVGSFPFAFLTERLPDCGAAVHRGLVRINVKGDDSTINKPCSFSFPSLFSAFFYSLLFISGTLDSSRRSGEAFPVGPREPFVDQLWRRLKCFICRYCASRPAHCRRVSNPRRPSFLGLDASGRCAQTGHRGVHSFREPARHLHPLSFPRFAAIPHPSRHLTTCPRGTDNTWWPSKTPGVEHSGP